MVIVENLLLIEVSMNYLLINTANEELVILVYKDGVIYACNDKQIKRHNEVILPALDNLLNEANLTLKDIDEYGVVVGPGSFTGVRVGIATCKAFKDVFNKPVRAINNLDLLHAIATHKGLTPKVVAIEGSLNSYFVGVVDNGKLNIYERNLTAEELTRASQGEEVIMYTNSHNYQPAQCIEFDNEAFVSAFLNSNSYSLVPIYYQLSQAENDKLSRGELIVREAEVWDIKTISDIDKVNFHEPWDMEKMLLNKATTIYVAELEKNVIGFLVAENDIDEFNISRVVVSSEARNHGVGTKLINYIEEIAKTNKMNVSLEVSVNNFTAKTLYEKLGYITRRVRKNYYKDGSDCLEMVKTF